MDLSTISMSKQDIERERERYRRNKIMLRGLDALEEGRQLIDLREVLAASLETIVPPSNPLGHSRPEIAVAPCRYAGAKVQCQARRGSIVYGVYGRFREWAWRIDVRAPGARSSGRTTYRSAIPALPDHVAKLASRNDLVLWEAEWEAIAPADPALLEHLGGWLYVVKATWDMTPLERALLT